MLDCLLLLTLDRDSTIRTDGAGLLPGSALDAWGCTAFPVVGGPLPFRGLTTILDNSGKSLTFIPRVPPPPAASKIEDLVCPPSHAVILGAAWGCSTFFPPEDRASWAFAAGVDPR